VAFAGAGKSGLTGFLAGCARRRRRKKAAKSPASVQLFLKLDALAIDPTGKTSMALGTKKREARKSMHQPGWITLDGGFAARPCVVQDLSSSGAKVTIDDPNTLPAKLRLAFSRDARTGRNCEVVWRRGRTVGIKFVR
jgi:hypothetical protein